MLARVTNKSQSARGFYINGGETHFVEPGGSALLDLAEHVLHRAWEAAGEVTIEVAPDAPERKPDRGRRSRPN